MNDLIPPYVINTLALIGLVTLVWGSLVIALAAIGDRIEASRQRGQK